jgi:26S proteasome regulatory subunit N13
MYSDFFDQLGGAAGGRAAVASSGGSATSPTRPAALVSFPAGKMTLTAVADGSADTTSGSSSSTAKYTCAPDTRRGEVRLVYQSALGGAGNSNSAANNAHSGLYWQWYDRRDDTLVDNTLVVTPGSTWERVTLPASKKHARDRVYVWSGSSGSTDDTTTATPVMYWMQNASEEKEEELMVQVNAYLADPSSAAPATAAASAPTPATEGAAASTAAASATASSEAPPSQSQVDALSSILQNLGMPQSEGGDAAAAVPATAGGTGMLTLADLQGAMAGLPTASSASSAPLTEVLTPAALSSLLTSDDATRARLLALLPEDQRAPEFLEENLRSPQVQATLRALTQALLPDHDGGNGNMDSFYSVLANFSLDPADGQAALVAHNPIQAFLDCLLASVQKEEAAAADDTMEESKETE